MICMIFVLMGMKVISEKLLELSQAMGKLTQGAMNFLEESCVGVFYTVLHSEQMVDLME